MTVALVLLACRKDANAPPSMPDAAPAIPPPPVVRAVPQLSQELDGVTLHPEHSLVAQVKATPDQHEAQRLATQLEAAGVPAAVMRADLGERGVWFRVMVGDWSRRDLLDVQAPAWLEKPKVRALLGAPAPDQPLFVPVLVPRLEALNVLQARALSALFANHDAGAAPLPTFLVTRWQGQTHAFGADAGGAAGLVLGPGGSQTRLTLRGLEAPCAGASGPWVVDAVADMAGDPAPEWLVLQGPPERQTLVWATQQGAALQVLACIPLEVPGPTEVTRGTVTFRQLDTDADVELLVTGARLQRTPDGAVCDAWPRQQAVDVEHGAGRVMGAALHAANGVTRRQGGDAEIRAFLKGTADLAPELALDAALAYLAQAPDDAEVYGQVVARAEAAGREGLIGLHMRILAGLVNVHPQWRVGLAPRLNELLPSVVAYAKGGQRAPCRWPLLSAAQAQRASDQLAQQALAARHKRPDPMRLTPEELAALMMAFETGSPLAGAVDALVEALNGTPLLAQARQVEAQRRNAHAVLTPPQAPGTPTSVQDQAPPQEHP